MFQTLMVRVCVAGGGGLEGSGSSAMRMTTAGPTYADDAWVALHVQVVEVMCVVGIDGLAHHV
jgi:hypothetical protein